MNSRFFLILEGLKMFVNNKVKKRETKVQPYDSSVVQ